MYIYIFLKDNQSKARNDKCNRIASCYCEGELIYSKHGIKYIFIKFTSNQIGIIRIRNVGVFLSFYLIEA